MGTVLIFLEVSHSLLHFGTIQNILAVSLTFTADQKQFSAIKHTFKFPFP
jgi:hypothetical protein